MRHTQDKWITTCSLNKHSLSKSKSFNKFLEFDASEGFSKTVCHMQVHSPRNDIPTVILIPNYTSPSSMAATFLVTHLITVLQPSRYSIFHSRDTPIQLGLPWRSYSCQCLNTETSARSDRSFTTEISSIFYTISLYIRLVVTL